MTHTKARRAARVIAIALAIAALFAVPASAELSRFFDDGAGISEADAQALTARLDELSERVGVDVVIYSDKDLDGGNTKAMFDAIADSGEYRHDILCLVVGFAGKRNMWIGYEGDGERAVWSARESIFDRFAPKMSSGDYLAAYNTFIDAADEYITYYREHGRVMRDPFPWGSSVLAALVIGFIIALIRVLGLRAELKSVAPQRGAASYLRAGSLNVSESADTFLYRNVTRSAKPKKSSSSGGGSGSRGGGGRSF